ncbi:MAG: hypothetical protein JJ879_03885 [Sneathiella sp.]|nr:hypothetical protein [Sneathiella sp.]
MSTAEKRQKAIDACVDQIREIVGQEDPSKATLEIVKAKLIELSAHKDLFTLADFPPPDANTKRRSCLYRLSEDDDFGFALYANVADGNVDAPPHDHTTWAVIVGLLGQEENRFYSRAEDGVKQVGGAVVEEGTGVALLPDDLHSIHIKQGAPVLNFHMYGRALEQVPGRNYWSEPNGEWRTFPAHTDIREARYGY